MKTTLPPDMLDKAMMMARRAEYCPDALNKSICHEAYRDFSYVMWMFRAFGGDYTQDLAENTIKFYKDNF